MFYSSTNTATNNTPSITLTLIRIIITTTTAAAAAVINGTEDGPGDTHDDDD